MTAGFNLTESMRRPRGHFRMRIMRYRTVIDIIDEPNLVVDNASAIMAALMAGASGAQPISVIGFGTNGTAPQPTDTHLTGAYTKAVDGATIPSFGLVVFAFSLGTAEANGEAIAEFGLLTAAGVLAARKTRAAGIGPIDKTSELSFSGSWSIQF